MAYRGGNIDINIKGDSTWNLDEHDFKVLVYPDRHTDEVTILDKADMKSIGGNHYSGTIPYTLTKGMALGYHTIEVLIIENETSRCVFAKPSALIMHDSASKDIE
jgi:hypothetical protein